MYKRQARPITNGIARTGELPGLKSEAIAKGIPSSINLFAGAGLPDRNRVVAGSKTAIVPAFFILFIPFSDG